MDKSKRFIGQTTHLICAKCGGDNEVSNSISSGVLFIEYGELMFKCQCCGEIYDILPFSL